MNGKDKFHFEINSFAEFVQFIAIIREEEFDFSKIARLTAEVEQNSQALKNAIDSQTKK